MIDYNAFLETEARKFLARASAEATEDSLDPAIRDFFHSAANATKLYNIVLRIVAGQIVVDSLAVKSTVSLSSTLVVEREFSVGIRRDSETGEYTIFQVA